MRGPFAYDLLIDCPCPHLQKGLGLERERIWIKSLDSVRSLGNPLPHCQVTHMSLPLGLLGLEGRNRCPTET